MVKRVQETLAQLVARHCDELSEASMAAARIITDFAGYDGEPAILNDAEQREFRSVATGVYMQTILRLPHWQALLVRDREGDALPQALVNSEHYMTTSSNWTGTSSAVV